MPESDTSILIATATYNERDSLPPLLDTIRRIVPNVDLLVIDDNSPDGTGEWVERERVNNHRLYVIHRPAKLGLGTATLDAMQYAVDHDYDVLVTLDADGSHRPEYIPEMLARIDAERSDAPRVIVGSRYIPGGGTEGWPWYRRIMSRSVNMAAHLLLGLPVHDCSGAFRAMPVSLLRRIDRSAVRSRGYSFFEEILWHFKRAGATFQEFPILFVDRRWGESKINAREAASSLVMLVRLGIANWLHI